MEEKGEIKLSFATIECKCLTKCWSTFFTVVLKITVYPLRQVANKTGLSNLSIFQETRWLVCSLLKSVSLALKVAVKFCKSNYRWLSLSQSPGDQTKYFELSVVWDSQFVTSCTLYMYTDCLDHRDYNLHVHVFGNDILEFKYPLTELLISHTNFEKAATEIKECWWLLTSKNVVKQCYKVTKAPLRTPLGIIEHTWLRDCVDY